MHIEQGEPLLHDQKPLERAAQLIRWHNERKGSLRGLGFESTEILNELGFKRGMERAGNEAEHGDRRPLIVKREAEDRSD